jgi:DNA gyrase/topoisomerase IV subunit B
METYTNYKGFGISYSTFGGTTTVDQYGMTIKRFKALGEMKGKEEAKKYIDSL